MKNKEDKKLIQKEVKALIAQGISKQEIYDTLVGKYSNRKMVADTLRYTPTKDILRQYSVWNTLYLILLSSLALLSLLSPTVVTIWLIVLIILVAMKRFEYYYWNIILGIISIISTVGISLYGLFENETAFFSISNIIGILISIVFIVGGIILPQKFTPNYVEKKQKYTDKNGNQKLRIVHKFN